MPTASGHSSNTASSHVIPLRKTKLWLVAFYTLCLWPISMDGLSVNYIFASFPIGVLIFGGRLIRPRKSVVLFIWASVVAFSVAAIYQINWIQYFDRRFVSFLLFLSMFSFCFVRITRTHVESFKLAVVIAAIFFSLLALLQFASLGDMANSFESKDIVGSQRYGFVYVLAFWILWHERTFINLRAIRLALLLVLIIGVLLTFSRASVVSFACSAIAAIIYTVMTERWTFYYFMRRAIYALSICAVGVVIVHYIAPVVFDFFNERIVDYIVSGKQFDDLSNADASDGVRMYIWSNVIEFVTFNPITGAGFLGTWVLNLFGEVGGSAHNQYIDALFRLGPILFIAYIYFLYRIIAYAKNTDPGLYIGIIGVLIYGLFHETFKESHGAFILAMLIGITMTRERLMPILNRRAMT